MQGIVFQDVDALLNELLAMTGIAPFHSPGNCGLGTEDYNLETERAEQDLEPRLTA